MKIRRFWGESEGTEGKELQRGRKHQCVRNHWYLASSTRKWGEAESFAFEWRLSSVSTGSLGRF